LKQVLTRMLMSTPVRLAIRVLAHTPLRRFILSGTYDPVTGFHVGTGDMARDWDERARRNARYYIALEQDQEGFHNLGAHQLRDDIICGLSLGPHIRALEVGCGSGRLLAPLSSMVGEAHGVDISQEMLKRARTELANYPNAHVHHTQGELPMFADEMFDFCYSYHVFQHIPVREAIVRYLQEIHRVLKRGGTARLHFAVATTTGDTRRAKGGTWFGVLMSQEEIRRHLEGCGLTIAESRKVAWNALWDGVMYTCRK
jgi:cyclopropane fatty-acyl-phospholipid synthase-like methyltransferase